MKAPRIPIAVLRGPELRQILEDAFLTGATAVTVGVNPDEIPEMAKAHAKTRAEVWIE